MGGSHLKTLRAAKTSQGREVARALWDCGLLFPPSSVCTGPGWGWGSSSGGPRLHLDGLALQWLPNLGLGKKPQPARLKAALFQSG